MKRLTHVVLLGLMAVCGHAADQELLETVLKASRHLANQSSYSWVTKSVSAEGTMSWRQGPTLGKTLKGEHTHVAFTLGDSTIELAFKEMKSAIKLQDQWYAAAELKDERAWISDRLRDYKFPAKEAAFLARHSKDLKPVDSKAGEVEGSLTKKAIYDILSRGRNVVEEAPGVSGRVSFRVEKGQLVGYEYTLKGKMTMPPDAREVILDRTTVVEIRDVRNTKVSLPQECQIKLK